MDENELLELNADLMILIREKQEKGALNEAISLQILLHKNLMRLRQYMINPQMPIPDAPKTWKPPLPRAQRLPSGDAESTLGAKGQQSKDDRGSCSKKQGEKRSGPLLQHRQRQQQPLLLKRPRRETKPTGTTTGSRPEQGRAAEDSTSGRESGPGEDGEGAQEQQAEAAPEPTALFGASREDSTRPMRLQEGQGATPGGQEARSGQPSTPPQQQQVQQQQQERRTSKPSAHSRTRYRKSKPSKEERRLEKMKMFHTTPKKRLEPKMFQPPPLFAPPWMASVSAVPLVSPFPPAPFSLSIPPGVGNTAPIPAPLRLPAVTSRASKSSAAEQGPGPAAIDRRGIDGKDPSQQQESGRDLEATDGEGLRMGRSRSQRSPASSSLPTRPPSPSKDGGNEELGPGNRLEILLNVGRLQSRGAQHMQGHVPLVVPEERGGSLGAPPHTGAPTLPPPAPLPSSVRALANGATRSLRDKVSEDGLRGESPAAREPNRTIDAQPWVRREVQSDDVVA
ncbi:unnamed protein product [Ascophyllum nodosum]